MVEIVGRRQFSSEQPVQPENPQGRQLVIDTFNAVYQRMQTTVTPLLERRAQGEPRRNFNWREWHSMNGFELVRFVKEKVMGADTPLDTAVQTFTYPATFFYGKNPEKSYTIQEGIPVDPLRDFLAYEEDEITDQLGVICSHGRGDRALQEFDEDLRNLRERRTAIQNERAIFFVSSVPYQNVHRDLPLKIHQLRIEAEAYIISQNPWRALQKPFDNHISATYTMDRRSELVVPR